MQRPWRVLTDEEWSRIEPLLPQKAHTGRPRADDRETINGIFYVLAHRCRWQDMPADFGSYKTCWRRHKQWSEAGVWPLVERVAQVAVPRLVEVQPEATRGYRRRTPRAQVC